MNDSRSLALDPGSSMLDARKSENDTVIKQCIKYIVDSVGAENIDALILVGSFSRGEGIVAEDNGKLRWLSDLEFVAVVRVSAFARLRVQRVKLENGVENHINSSGINTKVSLGFTTKKHLRKLKPYIFTIEMKKYGKVLWGDKSALEIIPDFSYTDIDPKDGFILLNNRIVEQLMLLDKIETGCPVYQYEIDKGYIQIVNSILAFKILYKSLYSEKKEAFFKIYGKIEYLKYIVPALEDRVRLAFASFKDLDIKPLSKEKALNEWKNLRSCIRSVWIYEASNLTGNDVYDIKILINVFTAIPGVKNRIRGWIKYFISKGKSFPDIRTSPQFKIYEKAISEYSSDKADMVRICNIVEEWKRYVK